jgi:hypothetical protein
MPAFVIDDNLLIVAEKAVADEHTSESCRQNCLLALRQAQKNVVVLDKSDQILSGYLQKLRPLRRELAGSEFLIWLLQNQYHSSHCERVTITPLDDSFAEVPPEIREKNASGQRFDRKDHKWLAVARASVNSPVILNATDTDWRDWLGLLEQNGFLIRFVCPELMVTDAKPT